MCGILVVQYMYLCHTMDRQYKAFFYCAQFILSDVLCTWALKLSMALKYPGSKQAMHNTMQYNYILSI